MTDELPEEDEGPGADPPVSHDYHFAPVPEGLVYDLKVDPLAVRVYATLMRHGLTPDTCFPSHKRIGALIGVSERSVQRPVRTLEQQGWVKRKPRHNRRGDRISDGYHVFSTKQPIALPSAPSAPDSAGGDAGPDRADERELDRADERGLDRASQRGQEREPSNDSHPKESNPDQELASTPASADDGDRQPAGQEVQTVVARARQAAMVLAADELSWRDQSKITNPAALAAHIAREDIWPRLGKTFIQLAANRPTASPEVLAAAIQDLSNTDEGTGRAAALMQEAESRAFLEAPIEAADEAQVRQQLQSAREALRRARREGDDPC